MEKICKIYYVKQVENLGLRIGNNSKAKLMGLKLIIKKNIRGFYRSKVNLRKVTDL
jgi:hypothetical protein